MKPSRAETRRLRATIVERAASCCEACGRFVGDEGQMDHMRGRAKARQSAQNCWYLCVSDHESKGQSRPSAVWWLELYRSHSTLHGHAAEVEWADTRIAVLRQKFGPARL